jgi:hypothetical protein
MQYLLRRVLVLAVAMAVAPTGFAYAAHSQRGHGTRRHVTAAKRHRRKKKAHGVSRGATGPRGATGAQGPAGSAGSAGPTGPAGSGRAYGLVVGRGVPNAGVGSSGPSPYLHNATIQAGTLGSPSGIYCITVSATVAIPNMTVIAGGAELPSTAAQSPGEVVVPFATWLTSAPDCAGGQLEVRTYAYTSNAGNLVASPSDLVSFSFVVP